MLSRGIISMRHVLVSLYIPHKIGTLNKCILYVESVEQERRIIYRVTIIPKL